MGAKRWPASRRRHWPLSIGLSTIATTSFAYSSGLPSRFGNAASLVNAAGELVGDALGEAGGEQARRDGQHPDAQAAEVAGHRQAHARDAGLGRGVGDLPDLALERGDGRGVDDDAALLGLVVDGFLLAHVERREPADVEGADEVEVDGLAERLQAVRAVLLDGALADAAAGGGHDDVQPAELVDGLARAPARCRRSRSRRPRGRCRRSRRPPPCRSTAAGRGSPRSPHARRATPRSPARSPTHRRRRWPSCPRSPSSSLSKVTEVRL